GQGGLRPKGVERPAPCVKRSRHSLTGQVPMTERLRKAFRNYEVARGLGDGEVVEIPLLLSGWQAAALEKAAHHRGLTTAELVRSLLNDFFSAQARGEGLRVG